MRAAPPISDDWKPGAGRKARKFGIRVTYGPTLFGTMLTWNRWFPNERARKQAIENYVRRRGKYHAESI